MCLIVCAVLVACRGPATPTVVIPGHDAPFPPTWTPTPYVEDTPTATLVVQPTPTWDGTPPPPSEAYVPRLTASRLYRIYEDVDAVTLIDVRTKAAYEQAHIPGALHIPLDELEERVGELDGNKTIIAYCLSPNESMSLQAAMTLYELGFSQVAVLDGGIQKWYADGYPIEGTLLTPTVLPLGPRGTVTPLVTVTEEVTPAATPTPVSTQMSTVTTTPTSTPTSG